VRLRKTAFPASGCGFLFKASDRASKIKFVEVKKNGFLFLKVRGSKKRA
jgi:hypothetical protein